MQYVKEIPVLLMPSCLHNITYVPESKPVRFASWRRRRRSLLSPTASSLAVARSSSNDNAMRYALPVLWMTVMFSHIMGGNNGAGGAELSFSVFVNRKRQQHSLMQGLLYFVHILRAISRTFFELCGNVGRRNQGRQVSDPASVNELTIFRCND